jgi:hypothetical protein
MKQSLSRKVAIAATLISVAAFAFACGESTNEGGAGDGRTLDGGLGADVVAPDPTGQQDGGADASQADASQADVAVEAARVLPEGLGEPIPYLSRADSPFQGVAFPSYFHFEDWEDGLVNTPGATPSSTQLGSSFGALVDSIDGDDGAVDGKCEKAGGSCDSGFGNGTFEVTFDAAVLGGLPTHAGMAWTDGSTGCDAIFEAYDANDVLIGTKTAVAVGDGTNVGAVAEDRFFSVVHAAGVKRIVVKSSAGGVEVDHLQYGR